MKRQVRQKNHKNNLRQSGDGPGNYDEYAIYKNAAVRPEIKSEERRIESEPMRVMAAIGETRENASSKEVDRSWEISLTRKLVIALFIYLLSLAWLFIIGSEKAFLKSIVPSAGYLLSEYVLNFVKSLWIKKLKSSLLTKQPPLL